MTREGPRQPIPEGWRMTYEKAAEPQGTRNGAPMVYVLIEPDGTRHEFDRRRTVNHYLQEHSVS